MVTVGGKFLFVLLKRQNSAVLASVYLSVVVGVLDTLVILICVIKFTITYNNNE